MKKVLTVLLSVLIAFTVVTVSVSAEPVEKTPIKEINLTINTKPGTQITGAPQKNICTNDMSDYLFIQKTEITDKDGSKKLTADDSFENNHEYDIFIQLAWKDGKQVECELAEDLKVTLNGKEQNISVTQFKDYISFTDTIVSTDIVYPELSGFDGDFDGEAHTVTVKENEWTINKIFVDGNAFIEKDSAKGQYTLADLSVTHVNEYLNGKTISIWFYKEGLANVKKTAVINVKSVKNSITTDAVAIDIPFDNKEHDLLSTLPVAEFGCIEYSLDGGNTWSIDAPKATEPGEYPIKYRAAEDDVFGDWTVGDSKEVTAKINDRIVFFDYVGEYDGEEHVITYHLPTGVEYNDHITKVTIKGNSDEANRWKLKNNSIKATNVDDSWNNTWVWVYVDGESQPYFKGHLTINPATNTITTDPVANTSYMWENGDEYQLIATNGEAKWGEIEYSLDGEEWSTELPTASKAGEYVISYRASKDSVHGNYVESEVKTVSAIIDEDPLPEFVVTGFEGEYDGEEHCFEIVVPEGYELSKVFVNKVEDPNWQERSVTNVDDVNNGDAISAYVFVNGRQYKKTAKLEVTKTINEIVEELVPAEDLVENGEPQVLVDTDAEAKFGDVEYSLDGEEWSTELPEGEEYGKYTIYYRAAADEEHGNYDASEIKEAVAEILPNITFVGFEGDYDGEEHGFELSELPEGCTINKVFLNGTATDLEIDEVVATNVDDEFNNAHLSVYVYVDKLGRQVKCEADLIILPVKLNKVELYKGDNEYVANVNSDCELFIENLGDYADVKDYKFVAKVVGTMGNVFDIELDGNKFNLEPGKYQIKVSSKDPNYVDSDPIEIEVKEADMQYVAGLARVPFGSKEYEVVCDYDYKSWYEHTGFFKWELNDNLRCMTIDGDVVDPDYYTVVKGSTVFTYTPKYPMMPGIYKVGFHYENGMHVEGTLIVYPEFKPVPQPQPQPTPSPAKPYVAPKTSVE